MKNSSSEIHVELRDNQPCLIGWAGRTYYVERMLKRWTANGTPSSASPRRKRGVRRLLDTLLPSGRDSHPPEKREYYRVKVDEGELEIYRVGQSWYLSGVVSHGEEGEFWRPQEQRAYRHHRIF